MALRANGREAGIRDRLVRPVAHEPAKPRAVRSSLAVDAADIGLRTDSGLSSGELRRNWTFWQAKLGLFPTCARVDTIHMSGKWR